MMIATTNNSGASKINANAETKQSKIVFTSHLLQCRPQFFLVRFYHVEPAHKSYFQSLYLGIQARYF